MKAKTKLTKLWSFLLSLVMLLSLLPTTAFAASYAEISVNDIILKDNYYLKSNTATTANSSSTEPSSYVAWYKNGVLTLKGYNGKGIETQGVAAGELTVKLIGSNSINNGALVSDNGGDITVTSDSSGTLSISKTTSGYNPAIGIETGLSGSYTTGNVTIKGNAKVTIDMTHNGTKGYDRAYGIYAKENITISENASVDITCATPNNTTGGGNCNGLYAQKNVSIDTTGTIKIDVTNAGKDKDNGYSYGVYYMSTATLTKVGNMEVQWKKEVSYSSHSGGAILRGASLSDTDYAINEDTTNCYASYRFGTPRTVTAGNGKLTGPGVKYPDGNGKFLAGDKVNITPATKKGRSGEEIPFKEWTSSDVMLDKSATTASNSFTVPGKDVTVTAKHSPFVGTPTFTPTGSTGTDGTLTFKTVVDLADGSEVFCLVKDGEQNDESKYISFRTDNSPSASPYEYSYETRSLPGGNQVKAGDYYVAEYLNGNYYLSEKFTVNYTAPVTTYTVSFNANGGTGTMADVTDISGEYTLPANGFTAPAGKQFKAWSVGGVEKAAGDKITVTANTTVTAVWENTPVVTYTVSFAANGGTGTMADVTGISGEYTLPANGFTAPAGKQFKAWSVGGVEKAAGDKITVTANTTVTAVWEAIEYNVTVTSGTASVGAGTPITKATMGTTVTLTANAAPSGKVFDKWEVVSGGITLADANSATTTFTMPAEAVSVKATYKNAPHTPTPTPTPTHTHNLTLVAAKAATCTEGGKEAYYKCEGCGKFYEDVLGTKEITDLASWGNIAKIAHTTKLNATSLTYNGKVRTPKVIVKDETGKTLVKNTDYTVSYAKGRKYVGKYAVKITFKGKYSGTKTLYFTIKPKATSISSFTVGSKKFTVKWKKQATQTTGYQVQYSASSEFSKAKTVTVGKNTTVSKKISKLSGKKKYYVRVRTYKTVKINGKSIRIYSGWSKAKTVTTKK